MRNLFFKYVCGLTLLMSFDQGFCDVASKPISPKKELSVQDAEERSFDALQKSYLGKGEKLSCKVARSTVDEYFVVCAYPCEHARPGNDYLVVIRKSTGEARVLPGE